MIVRKAHVKMAVPVLTVWAFSRVNACQVFVGSIVKLVSIQTRQQVGFGVKFINDDGKQGYCSKIKCKRDVTYTKL